jgi:hypothetical protein
MEVRHMNANKFLSKDSLESFNSFRSQVSKGLEEEIKEQPTKEADIRAGYKSAAIGAATENMEKSRTLVNDAYQMSSPNSGARVTRAKSTSHFSLLAAGAVFRGLSDLAAGR